MSPAWRAEAGGRVGFSGGGDGGSEPSAMARNEDTTHLPRRRFEFSNELPFGNFGRLPLPLSLFEGLLLLSLGGGEGAQAVGRTTRPAAPREGLWPHGAVDRKYCEGPTAYMVTLVVGSTLCVPRPLM